MKSKTDILIGKTILITGVSGFIGKNLLNRMRQIDNVRLVLLSRNSINFNSTSEILIKSSLEQLTKKIWGENGIEKIDVVFHLAAFTPKSAEQADRIDENLNNIADTDTLLKSLPNIPEKIIFSSTLDVYAEPEENYIIVEKSKVGPRTEYGKSKLSCENLIILYSLMHKCKYVILRYGHIYGPGEEKYAKLIPQTIMTLLKNQAPKIYGDGSGYRDFLYVDDAVEATLRATTNTKKSGDTLNIVRGQSKRILECIDIISELMNFAGEYEYVVNNNKSISLQFDSSKMFRILGRWKLVPFEDGLIKEIDHLKKITDSSK